MRKTLAAIAAALTGAPRYVTEADGRPGSAVFRAFRAYEWLFGRRVGIKAESATAVFTDARGRLIVEQRFFTWEAALMYTEHRLRAFLRNPLRLPKMEWVRVMQPAVHAGPGQPFALPSYRLAVAYDSATQGTSGVNSNTGVSGSLTCAGSDRFLIVHAFNTAGGQDVNNVVFNSIALTEYGAHPSEARLDTWYQYAPSATTANVTTTISASDKNHFVAASYSGAKQTSFPDNVASDVDTNTTAGAISLTPNTNNCWVLGVSHAQRVASNVNGQPTAGAGTTRRAQAENYNTSTNAFWSTGIFDNNASVSPAASTTLNFASSVAADLYNRAFSLAIKGTDYTLTADAGSYALTGTAAGLVAAARLVADAGSYVITGTAATIGKGYMLVAEAGSYALTGVDAALTAARSIVADAGSYLLTGTAAALTAARTLLAEAGSYVLTGFAAAITSNAWAKPPRDSSSFSKPTRDSSSWTRPDDPYQ